MDVKLFAKKLCGRITPPPFKSEAIRLILLYTLSGEQPNLIVHSADCVGDDINHALSAAKRLLTYKETELPIDVGESATLLRLVLPSMLALYGEAKFKVGNSLYSRSLKAYSDGIGCKIKYCQNGVIEVFGKLEPKEYIINASESSQFISGMLLALPLVPGMSISMEGVPVSTPYLDLTITLMEEFGVNINRADGRFEAAGFHYTVPNSIRLSADSSYAANFICANYFGSSVEIADSPASFVQADSIIGSIIDEPEISIRNCPDLFPILVIAACGRKSITTIYDTHRLCDKESNRVLSMLDCITKLGGSMEIFDDHVVIHGKGHLQGGIVDSHNDHRIVMAVSIAALISKEPIIIQNAEAVSKSAPQFFDDYRALGGTACEYIW